MKPHGPTANDLHNQKQIAMATAYRRSLQGHPENKAVRLVNPQQQNPPVVSRPPPTAPPLLTANDLHNQKQIAMATAYGRGLQERLGNKADRVPDLGEQKTRKRGLQERFADKIALFYPGARFYPCECFDYSCAVLPIPRRGCYDQEEIAFPPATVAEMPVLRSPTVGRLSASDFTLRDPLRRDLPLLAKPVVTESLSPITPGCIKSLSDVLEFGQSSSQPADFQLLSVSITNHSFSKRFTVVDFQKFFWFTIADFLLPVTTVRQIDLSKVVLTGMACRISSNLFRPIQGVKIAGKSYGESLEASEKQVSSQSRHRSPRNNGYRISFTYKGTGSVTRQQSLSLWELLLPVLQNPVNLDKLEQPELPAPLWQFQLAGIGFLIEREGALLGDDMGTGKTVQTAVAMRVLFQKKAITSALIVCPLSVLRGWDRELGKWAPNLCVTVVRGSKEFRRLCWRQPAHVWLTTFDTLRNDIRTVLNSHPKGFGLAVIDEAQRIKNPSTGYSRAVRRIDAPYHWALSGTPLENKLGDVFGVFSFVKSGLFAPKEEYTPEQVNKRIKPYFLRRRKQDVLKDLPELVESHVWLRLEGEQRRSYEQLEKQSVLKLHQKGEEVTAQTILVLLQKLKQVCNRCPASDESAKLEWLRDNLEDIAAEGDKCLIFTQYRQKEFGGTDWLEEQLSQYCPLNYGTVSSDDGRETILRKFKDHREHLVFLAHPKTAGVGLNELVVANYVIHFDHWWNPATAHQATARAHRPGQTKKVFAYHLWVEDTVEERIFRKIEDKQQLYAEVVDSLSIGLSEEMLFEVYDDLLAKYGLKVRSATKEGDGKNSTHSLRTVDIPSDAPIGDAAIGSEIVPGEIWGNDPISIRQMAVLLFFGKAANARMTKGEASEQIDKLFANEENRQTWENAKTTPMSMFAGTPLYDFAAGKRKLAPKRAQKETLDDALIAIQFNLDSKRAAKGWQSGVSTAGFCTRPVRDAKGRLNRWVVDWVISQVILTNPLSDTAPVTFRIDGQEITREHVRLGDLYDLRKKQSVQLWIGEPHQLWEQLSRDDVHTLVRAYEKTWLE